MRVVLWMLPAAALACGGSSGRAQLSVGGTYETTASLAKQGPPNTYPEPGYP
jgi:hypothetical protein